MGKWKTREKLKSDIYSFWFSYKKYQLIKNNRFDRNRRVLIRGKWMKYTHCVKMEQIDNGNMYDDIPPVQPLDMFGDCMYLGDAPISNVRLTGE